MSLTTNFAGGFSRRQPVAHAKRGNRGRCRLRWQADDLITQQDIAVAMPEKINPGRCRRMSFFAPVCLRVFFVLGGVHRVAAPGLYPQCTIYSSPPASLPSTCYSLPGGFG
ncbi:MAG: hypothetical protein U1F68_10760 [Gammaproteobacteria bacterium]